MSKMRQYKRFLLLLALLPTAALASALKKKDVPQDRFAVTVSIDSAIASVPQKMYMFSLGEVCSAALPAALKLESSTVLYRTTKPADLTELKPKEALLLASFNDKVNELELSKASKYTGLKNNIAIIKNLIGMGYLVADKVIEEKYKPKIAKFVSLSENITSEDELRQTLDALAQKTPKQFETLMTFVKILKATASDGTSATLHNEIERKTLLQNPRISPSALAALISKSLLTETQHEVSRIAAYDGDIQLSRDLTAAQTTAYNDIKSQFEHKNTVLLRGVNDDPAVIRKLMEGLLAARVRPYYLLQMDLVRGGGHFRTPLETGVAVIDALRGHTSGLAVPHFIVDLPGGRGKVELVPQYLLRKEGKRAIFRNHRGEECVYPEVEV